MIRKVITILVALSFAIGALTLSSSATDNPPVNIPVEDTLSPMITYYSSNLVGGNSDGRFTLYNPYSLNDTDLGEILWFANSNSENCPSQSIMYGNYMMTDELMLGFTQMKDIHRDELGDYYFANYYITPQEVLYDSMSTFTLRSEWYGIWATSNNRRIGVYLYDPDDNAYSLVVRLRGQTAEGNIDYCEHRMILHSSDYSLIPIESMYDDLDPNYTYDYYQIEVFMENPSSTIPHEIGFLTPLEVVGTPANGYVSSNVFVADPVEAPIRTTVSYEHFDLLGWLGSALDGFMDTTVFYVGDVDVTFGIIIGSSLALVVLIAFLRRYSGG